MSEQVRTPAVRPAAGAAAVAAPRPVFRIVPPGRLDLDLGELWRSRELLYFLVWRDLKVRYKQTALGVVWAILQPLAAMAIFSLVLGRFAKVPSNGLPYPVFVYAGLLVWLYFSQAVSSAGTSIVGNANLITKVYFPRLVIPTSAVLMPLVDFLLSGVVLGGLMTIYGIAPDWHIVALPPLLLLVVASALGVGLWVAALNVRYRDVPYALPFLLQIWLFASPVVYPAQILPDRWRWVFALNPLTGAVDGFRWALLDQGAADASVLAVGAGVALLLLASGIVYFRRVQDSFADVI
jgi:lipopolysaccharide transport system permease protein